ncbi:MAG: hypothetical protein B7Y81_16095 [Caulobacter sp. 32-67-35]|nr:MAG: hypothetical protein B7Y81_16095 [Caulobacter sp. 32-67-35]
MELDREGLIEAIMYADGERALCTANDPKGFELITMNARLARALRDRFVGDRWEVDESDNQPGIRNPHLKVRVIPCNFDENAGNRLADPSNLRDKGSASRSKTQCNKTAWLPGFEPSPETEKTEYETYVLGTYAAGGELRAELSKPQNFAAGKYTRFLPRIILLDGSEHEPMGAKAPREAPTEVIDIAVKRK